MAWTTLTMQVTTPLFNGGHKPPPSDSDGKKGSRDTTLDDAGVRISSLRGAMRYWLRAIAGSKVGNQIDVLAAVESRVFGSTARPSSIALRIPKPPQVNRNSQPDWCRRNSARWIGYLAGQGLSKPDGRDRIRLDRAFVAPGETFPLQLRVGADQDAAALAVAALWALCRYGGLGARTRRGFGGLRIIEAEGGLPAPWTPQRLYAAAAVPSDGLDLDEHGLPPEIAACADSLDRIVTQAHDDLGSVSVTCGGWQDVPTYPVFGDPSIFMAGLSDHTFTDWSEVLGYAGEQFRWFRASENAPGESYDPPIKTWEWLHTVCDDSNRFALGALGLPINFKGRVAEPVSPTTSGGRQPLRRASPLWLRPILDHNDHWRLLSFAFLGRFLPEHDVEVLLSRHKRLDVSTADVVEHSRRWMTVLGQGGSFVRDVTRR